MKTAVIISIILVIAAISAIAIFAASNQDMSPIDNKPIQNDSNETGQKPDDTKSMQNNTDDEINKRLDDIKKMNSTVYIPKQREWQTSGPFQIDRTQYILGEKIFVRIGGLGPDDKGQIVFLRPKNTTHSETYLSIPFDGRAKPAFNYYLEPDLSKIRGICTIDDLVGDWTVVFRGTNYPNLEFSVSSEILPGDEDSYKPVCLSGKVALGSLLSLTGEFEAGAQEDLVAINLAVDDFNTYLKDIDQRWSIDMQSKDSETNPDVALEEIKSFHENEINLIVGPETSENIKAVKEFVNDNDMLLVSCCSSAPTLAIANDNVYRLVPDDTDQGRVMAKIMIDEGIQVMIPVWRGDLWGDGLLKAISDSFVESNGTVMDGIRYDTDSPDIPAIVSELEETVQDAIEQYGKDKVAIQFIGGSQIVSVFDSAITYDILDDVRWFGSGWSSDPALTDDNELLEFSSTVQFTIVEFTIPSNPTLERIHEHIVEELSRSPIASAYAAYDAVWLIGLSMLETQSTDGAKIKNILPDIANNYVGASGDIKLNDAGDLATANYDIWMILDDQWILVGVYDSSTGSISYS